MSTRPGISLRARSVSPGAAARVRRDPDLRAARVDGSPVVVFGPAACLLRLGAGAPPAALLSGETVRQRALRPPRPVDTPPPGARTL